MLQTGTRLGDYDILDIHRSTKTEVIYRVKNTVAGRLEALKVLPESLQADSDALERFFREIKVHARLIHPNIVTFYHATQIKGMVVMTTELLEGATLADLLESGPLSPPRAASYIKQVLAALAHAHSQDIVHREVAPENIYILTNGQVKLGGFGLAKAKGGMNLTQEGTTLGPVHYMSPEQVKGSSNLDLRSDIYSAGCVLYEMLTGRKPFVAKSQFDVMLAHVQRDPVLAATANRKLAAHWSFVVGKAMDKKPMDRYASASAFAAAIDEALDRPESPSEPAPRPQRVMVMESSPPRQTSHVMAQANSPDHTLMWLMAAFVVVVVLFSLTLFMK